MNDKESSVSTKDTIRNQAFELFKKYGYENVTVMQICKASGITKRTFYYHYNSKEDLISGITDYLGIKAEQLLDSLVTQQTNVGMVWELMSVYSRSSEQYGPNIIKQIYVLMLQNKAAERFPFTTYLYNTVTRTLANAQRAGEIPDTSSPEEIAFALYHAFRSITITWASEDGAFDLVKAFRRVFETILGIEGGAQDKQPPSPSL